MLKAVCRVGKTILATVNLSAWKRPSYFVVTLASFLAISVGMTNWLKFEQYPLFSQELLLVGALLFATCAIASLFYIGFRPIVQIFADAALAAFATDLVTSGWIWPAFASIVAICLSAQMKGKFLEVAGVFSSFAILLTLVGIDHSGLMKKVPTTDSEVRDQSTAEQPAIIHIVFDEHIGIAGLPEAAYGDTKTNFLKEFYRNNGFSTFERAYSRHYHTKNSIPDTLNFGMPLDWQVSAKPERISPRLAYFELLKNEGYSISILQSDYIDFCSSNEVDECQEYASAGLGTLSESKLSVTEKTLLIMSSFQNLSEFLMALRRGFSILRATIYFRWGYKLPNLSKLELVTFSAATLKVVPQFEQKVRDAKPRSAIFFHALLPHFPYNLDRKCELRPLDSWQMRDSLVSLETRHRAYGEQIRCVNRIIERTVAAAQSSPARKNFLIVVHGDHGSRLNDIGSGAFTSMGHDDLIAGYSTLFAVRFPGQQPSSSSAIVSTTVLLSNLASNEFRRISVLPDEDPTVWHTDQYWTPTGRVPFPTEF